jgi:hypothetical protein
VDNSGAGLLAPITETPKPPVAPEQPDVVVPTDKAPRLKTGIGVLPPSRKLQPGDQVCGECGEGNSPNRRFCSRCGHSLAEAEVVRAKWWRKLLPRRRKRVVAAGTRPGRKGVKARRGGVGRLIGTVFRTVMKIVGIVVLIGGIVYASYAPFRTWTNGEVNSVEQAVLGKARPDLAQIHAFGSKASAQLPAHPGPAAVDGFTNTYWQAADNVPTREPLLTLTFDQPVTINRIIIRIGATAAFQKLDRPSVLHIVYDTGKVEDLTTKDTPDPQTLTVKNGAQVKSMTIQVTGLFRSAGATDMAITEIEFYGKDDN